MVLLLQEVFGLGTGEPLDVKGAVWLTGTSSCCCDEAADVNKDARIACIAHMLLLYSPAEATERGDVCRDRNMYL
jgi:hypothetical protein